MSEHDFQLQMVTQLQDLAVGQAEIATDMRAVKEHLKKLNGKVACHEQQLNERKNQCPLAGALEARIRPVEDFITAETASEKTSTAWMKRIWPIVWALCGVLSILILQHAPAILTAISPK